MKNFLLLALTGAIAVLVSCKDNEDPEPNPIIGEWELDEITISNPPSGYAIATSPNQISWYGENAYTITFFEDLTYERELSASTAKFEDNGTWGLDDNKLDLDQEESDLEDLITSFTVEGEITDRSMTLTTNDLWLVWPPEIVNDPTALDTADTQAEIDTLFARYGEVQECLFTVEFDKN